MFKRKKKDVKADFTIDLHPIEHTSEDTSASKKRLFLVFGVVILFVILAFLVIRSLTQPDLPEPSIFPDDGYLVIEDPQLNEEQPDNDLVDDPSSEDLVVPEPATKVEPKTPIEGYVFYENRLLGLKLLYPESWYYEDTSHTVLRELNTLLASGSLSLDDSDLTFDLPVADFISEDKLSRKVQLFIVPNNSSLLPSGGEALSLGNHQVAVTTSEVDDFGRKLYRSRYVVRFTKNSLLFDVLDVHPRVNSSTTDNPDADVSDLQEDEDLVILEPDVVSMDEIVGVMLQYFSLGVQDDSDTDSPEFSSQDPNDSGVISIQPVDMTIIDGVTNGSDTN